MFKHHPDRPGGSSEAFQIINEAREVLTNEEAKATYDEAYRPTAPAHGRVDNRQGLWNPHEISEDIRSATSHGHSVKYRRPSNVALGWGGYDEVHQWQARGRGVDKTMVESLNWHDPGPIRFVSMDNPEIVTASLAGFSNPAKVADDEEEAPKPKSLWRVLEEEAFPGRDTAELDALEKSLPLPITKGR